MKEIMNNNFRFALVIICFTFLVSNYSKDFFRRNELIESNIKKFDYMQDRNIEHILTRLNALKKN